MEQLLPLEVYALFLYEKRNEPGSSIWDLLEFGPGGIQGGEMSLDTYNHVTSDAFVASVKEAIPGVPHDWPLSAPVGGILGYGVVYKILSTRSDEANIPHVPLHRLYKLTSIANQENYRFILCKEEDVLRQEGDAMNGTVGALGIEQIAPTEINTENDQFNTPDGFDVLSYQFAAHPLLAPQAGGRRRFRRRTHRKKRLVARHTAIRKYKKRSSTHKTTRKTPRHHKKTRRNK